MLTRPNAYLVLLTIAVVAFAKAGWRPATRLLLMAALVTVPWIIRNEIRMHAFIPSSTNTGDTLCLDRNLTAQGGFRFADHDGCVDPNLPEVPRNSGNTRKAIEFVFHHPAREALQMWRRGRIEFDSEHDGLFATGSLGGGPAPGTHGFDVLAAIADWYFYVVVLVALAGVPLLFTRGRTPERRIVFVAFMALLVIPLLLWGNQRFHFPLLPFIALFAAAAVERVVVRFAHVRRSPDDLSVMGVREDRH